MKFIFPTSFLILILSCSEKNESFIFSYKLPKELDEVSGVAFVNNQTYVIEDHGNKNCIYHLKENGKIENEITVENVKNVDWEDLTSDVSGNLYIGDFGNNENIRKDLCIYKIKADQLEKNAIASESKTTFYYPEQKNFPPNEKEMFYDCESFFEWRGHFYLFTKNRSKDFDGTVLIYKVPNQPGHHKAELIDIFKTCNSKDHCVITSAAITKDGSKIALLSHSIVWVIENFKSDDFTNGEISTFNLQHDSQKEAICFKNNNMLVIMDESNESRGNAYDFSINDFETEN